MPHLQKIMESGGSGVLESDVPLISPKLWTSIFTGKKQEKHGIHFFGNTSDAVQCKRIWDIYNDSGLRVGIFGTLVTWPPRPVNGFIVPSIFALGSETYPEEYRPFQEFVLGERATLKEERTGKSVLGLVQSANKLRSYGISPTTFWYGLIHFLWEKARAKRYLDMYWRKGIVHLKLSVDMFRHLFAVFKPHFSTFHIHLCDAVSHRYWAFFEPEKFPEVNKDDVRKYGEVIPRVYEEADWAIGRIVSLADDETSVVIASDHGSTAFQYLFDPYLVNIERLFQILGIEKTVLPARFGLETFLFFQKEENFETILRMLDGFTLKGTNQKVFDTKCQSKYIILRISKKLQKTGVDEKAFIDSAQFGTVQFTELFYRPKMKISGVHHLEGVLIMAGPDIKNGITITDATIFDLTPTLLTLMGYPVAKDMDGRVLTEVFRDDFLKKSPVRYIKTYESPSFQKDPEVVDSSKVKERLKALGYL